MKFKALITAAFLGGVALAGAPSLAQDHYRGEARTPDRAETWRGGDDFRGDRDWRRQRPALTLVTARGAVSLRRDDRLFYTLASAPYYFRPGFTYEYSDRCNRRGCLVNVYRGHSDRPIDRIFAPHPPRVRMDQASWRQDNWRRDGWRGDGERYQRDQRDDARDRDGSDLEGGPRGRRS